MDFKDVAQDRYCFIAIIDCEIVHSAHCASWEGIPVFLSCGSCASVALLRALGYTDVKAGNSSWPWLLLHYGGYMLLKFQDNQSWMDLVNSAENLRCYAEDDTSEIRRD
ncbi:hypothetical protein ElyMa_005051500 [Elysia marginata]|uniref:Uncharacterized protein n=1 Tax=Elysia marginata TaxID=1093978 RepID=A0AAV4JFR4_9GAST|nr:hypothetical protein ElyMa_005051500 [Elysia marginata]